MVLGVVLAPSPVASAAAPEAACVYVVDDLARVRAGDRVTCPPLAALELAALRDEVVAFQVIVQAGDAPLAGARVDVELPGVRVERFVEHVHTRRLRRARVGRGQEQQRGGRGEERRDRPR